MKISALRSSAALVLLLIAAGLVIYGHWVILKSGALFDVPNQQTYADLRVRWVSDFAAKQPEGWWVKSGILVFCLAIASVFSTADALLGRDAFWKRLVLWVPACAIIAGLLLVVFLDMSPTRHVLHQPGRWSRFLGNRPYWVEDMRSASEWTSRWYHQLGFRLFAAGFISSQIAAGVWLFRRNIKSVWLTVFTLLTIASSVCLFCSIGTIPGFFQRALLVMMFCWMSGCVLLLRRMAPTRDHSASLR